jgi:hypothetical protein
MAGNPFDAATDAFSRMEPPSLNRGSAFLHREQESFDVDVECSVEVLFGNGSQSRARCADAGVGKQDIHVSFLAFHGFIQAVDIRQVRNVSLDARYAFANLFYRRFEFVGTTAGDKDIGPFSDEMLSGGEAHPAAPASDDRNFAI